eukprot:4821092-Prymnesium_polylepis.1
MRSGGPRTPESRNTASSPAAFFDAMAADRAIALKRQPGEGSLVVLIVAACIRAVARPIDGNHEWAGHRVVLSLKIVHERASGTHLALKNVHRQERRRFVTSSGATTAAFLARVSVRSAVQAVDSRATSRSARAHTIAADSWQERRQEPAQRLIRHRIARLELSSANAFVARRVGRQGWWRRPPFRGCWKKTPTVGCGGFEGRSTVFIEIINSIFIILRRADDHFLTFTSHQQWSCGGHTAGTDRHGRARTSRTVRTKPIGWKRVRPPTNFS